MERAKYFPFLHLPILLLFTITYSLTMELIPSSTGSRWKEYSTYWESQADQRTAIWHQERFCRLTASNVGTANGVSTFSTLEELALDITGIKKKTIDEDSRIRLGLWDESMRSMRGSGLNRHIISKSLRKANVFRNSIANWWVIGW